MAIEEGDISILAIKASYIEDVSKGQKNDQEQYCKSFHIFDRFLDESQEPSDFWE